jgi:phosphodiesterase/alkaline phosphatase D-like protein
MKRKSFLKYSFLLTGLSFFKYSRLSAAYTKAQQLFVNKVRFIWSGSISTTTVRVNAKLTAATTSARLVVSTDPSLSNPAFGSFSAADAANNYIAHLSATNLLPNTTYYYGIEADGIIDTAADAIGSFKTIASGPQSFAFTIASCNRDGGHPVFYRIKEKNPLFHITHGDFHYADPNSATDINVHRAPFEATLAKPAIRELLQHHPIAYMWDDHDYCGDNTNSFAAGRTNARLVYQEYVPHYPLVAGAGNVPIYQSFVVGRVRFILTDLRSERDVPGTTMMGAAQKAWFKGECLAAKNNDEGIVWINTVPWGNTPDVDIWYGFGAERTELSDFFKANAIRNLFIICGDAHMVAIDNGTNHDFSTGGNNPYKYPVLQAAAVNQTGSFRGGPFSEGHFSNPTFEHGQYVLVNITDTGGSSATVSLTGYRVDNTGAESTLITYAFPFSFLNVLPVKISLFSAGKSANGYNAVVTFRVEQATAFCQQAEVERSADGIRYETLEKVACGANTAGIFQHAIIDAKPLSGKNYYRLKVTEQTGQATYSNVEVLNFGKEEKTVVIQNPAQGHLQVAVSLTANTHARYVITDSLGRQLQQAVVPLQKGTNNYTLPLPPTAKGICYFALHFNGATHTQKFLAR